MLPIPWTRPFLVRWSQVDAEIAAEDEGTRRVGIDGGVRMKALGRLLRALAPRVVLAGQWPKGRLAPEEIRAPMQGPSIKSLLLEARLTRR